MQEIRRDVKFIGAALAVTFLVIGVLASFVAGPGVLVMGIVASATLFACGVLRWADIRSDIRHARDGWTDLVSGTVKELGNTKQDAKVHMSAFRVNLKQGLNDLPGQVNGGFKSIREAMSAKQD